MTQVQLIDSIVSLLNQLSSEIRDKGKLNLTDINVIAEDIMSPVLSLSYETNLVNLNQKKGNYPGIDLGTDDSVIVGDIKERIAFQVTSNNSSTKILETLKQIKENRLYEIFDVFYIYNLTEKQNSYSSKTLNKIRDLVEEKFKFDVKTNIIDRTDVEKKVMQLKPIDKIEYINNLLIDQIKHNRENIFSFQIWKSSGKIEYSFSKIINGVDKEIYDVINNGDLNLETKKILDIIFNKIESDYTKNFNNNINFKYFNTSYSIYLKGALSQCVQSFEKISNMILTILDKEDFYKNISLKFNNLVQTIDESDYPLVHNIIEYPAVKFVKDIAYNILLSANIDNELIDIFVKDFNQYVSTTVINIFGLEEYNNHLIENHNRWIQENELKLLQYAKNLPKLGFSDDEKLKYEITYGSWRDIRFFNDYTKNSIDYNEFPTESINISKTEKSLKEINILIDEYYLQFKDESEGYLNNILFLIADFGKGKSSFLHEYASSMAKNYLRHNDGPIPVYINLNEYHNYVNSPTLGIIGNYLAKRFKIDIKESFYKNKDYVFLIDSLDESGELTEIHIDKVIRDIKEIQNLDNIYKRHNKIIVASRPIDRGLIDQIKKHKPYLINRDNEKSSYTENYIALYGFKKDQFNEYIGYALDKYWSNNKPIVANLSKFAKEIFEASSSSDTFDYYKKFHLNVLTYSELRRPIFAYMIYKLIISNADFIDLGKVGVYVSFINQLSREAKHKDDITYKVKLVEEFTYRNVLHASALLWQYRRHNGLHTSLTKADICRTIEGNEISISEREILNSYPDINSIHFLSHSYFGEKDNTLHFHINLLPKFYWQNIT